MAQLSNFSTLESVMKNSVSNTNTEMFNDHFETPIGTMEVCASNTNVLSVFFVSKAKPSKPNDLTDLVETQLQEYFAGQRIEFDLSHKAQGTQFQQTVWKALSEIDYGTTCSYADIAKRISKPNAVRAVGAANGKNPLTIIVPCHRVIAANGKLSGYAGGVDRKSWLLAHEFRLKASDSKHM